jgi:transposase
MEGAAVDGMVRGEVGATERRSLRGGKRSRRRWSAAQKAAIVAESFAPGAKISDVAARYGLSASVLFNWRRQTVPAKPDIPPAVLDGPLPAAPSFVSVEICDGVADTDTIAVPHEAPRPVGCTIEIAVADANIRVAPGVDAATLATVLAVVRGAY